jgi:hypothetical protein
MFKIKRRISLIVLLGGSVALMTQFQNCAPDMAFDAASMNLDANAGLGDIQDLGVDSPTGEFQTKPISQFSAPLMDRQMVTAVLANAFGPSWSVESANIEIRQTDFGKTCSIYSEYLTNVSGKNVLGQESETCRFSNLEEGVKSLSTPVRSAYLTTACSDLSENATTFNYFLSKVGTAASRNSFSDDSLENAYRLFYVAKPPPSQSVIDSMRFIGNSQSDPNKAWAAIAFSLCASGQWQVL